MDVETLDFEETITFVEAEVEKMLKDYELEEKIRIATKAPIIDFIIL